MNQRIDTRSTWNGFQLHHYRFKLADEQREFDQIHRLVHRTFVVEIKQHPDAGTGMLVDKFHHKNRYLIAKRDDQICGMVAVHDQPPFSACDAIANPEVVTAFVPQLLEVRLLLVEPQHRHRLVFGGLMWSIHHYATQGGYRYLLISGLKQRQPMYEQLGFRPLGEAVQRGAAQFVPMSLPISGLPPNARRLQERLSRSMRPSVPIT